MTGEERVESYISSLYSGLPAYLEELEESAIRDGVPIIRPAMINFIRTMLAMHEPMTILEIGTAIGFSALLMREYAPKGCHITTIENYEPRIAVARENFSRYDDGHIKLIEGDASEIIRELTGGYDMIFMDGAKGQYINMYGDVKRLLRKGGIVLSDNVFQEGDILESRYAVRRRDRTIHSRMRDYLYRLTHDEDYVTSVLPVADGIAVSVKKETKE